MSKSNRVLPGFRITMAFTLLYLGLIVIVPLTTLPVESITMGWTAFHRTLTDPRVVASYKLSLGASFVAAIVNGVFGVLVAWVLVRYPFPGRRVIDALIDLPFALPTAVAGITLTTLYAPNGWLGALICLIAVFLPSFLLVIGTLPFWDQLRRLPQAQAVLRGVNAAVVGLLLAALYNPVWTAGITGPYDFALAVAAFLLLFMWQVPPWLVVVLSALGGAAIAQL